MNMLHTCQGKTRRQILMMLLFSNKSTTKASKTIAKIGSHESKYEMHVKGFF